MAEENTAEDLDDDSEQSTEESIAESDADQDQANSDEGASAAAQEDSAEPEDPEALSNSANEPTIGSEVPVVDQPLIQSGSSDKTVADISMILDIPVTLSMEIGQTRISINELLKLSKDSVIELQRMADEPLDVLVNGTLVAHGEAVVVGDRFGIRLTDVISPQERLRKFT
ncbi:MAG: flagellar motor switch protein FliN [Granulosicoccus sp.]